MNKTKITVVSLALLSLVASFAVAKEKDDGYNDNGYKDKHHHWSAPEIDPGQALGALALLGGTVAIVRGYRRKKK
jgi:hypothetical protein